MSSAEEQIKEALSSRRGFEIFEITPIALGGSPTDLANKVLLTREQHFEAVRYWNAVIRNLKESRSDSVDP